jgi:hypothetical protein
MKGELFFYQNIPPGFEKYFSKLIDFNKNCDLIELKIDFISGIPLYFLYKNGLFTNIMLDELFIILNKFHTYTGKNIEIQEENIYNNYFNKLKNRLNKNDYYFDDAEIVYEEIIQGLQNNYSPIIVQMIHGDFWFSNILLTYDDNYKFIDMKGQVDNILTISGDLYYDYGKLYQSILGYDLLLNRNKIDYDYIIKMKKYFLNKCKDNGLNLRYLKYVTKSLIFGTFHSIEDKMDVKEQIWKLLKSDLINCLI